MNLPKTIERWCCHSGKSCGLTTLELRAEAMLEWQGDTPYAFVYWNYYRDNDDPYFCRNTKDKFAYAWTQETLAAKVAETEPTQEEIDRWNQAYGDE